MLQARTAVLLCNTRVSPRARAAILGRPYRMPQAKEHRITVDCRTEKRTVEPIGPVRKPKPTAPVANPFQVVIRRNCRPAIVNIVVDAICRAFEIDEAHLTAADRTHKAAAARMAAYRLLREVGGYSKSAISRAFQRDHSTILSGLAKAAALHAGDPDWRARFDLALASATAARKAVTQ
jgi:hypothetical protein